LDEKRINCKTWPGSFSFVALPPDANPASIPLIDNAGEPQFAQSQ
jgi:hypothetical protein